MLDKNYKNKQKERKFCLDKMKEIQIKRKRYKKKKRKKEKKKHYQPIARKPRKNDSSQKNIDQFVPHWMPHTGGLVPRLRLIQ